MSKELIIVFVKNIEAGKVKTRLAKTIGDKGACDIYNELVNITENATKNLSADKRIYFSNTVDNSRWNKAYKTTQQGQDLGERMKNAFIDGFDDNYRRVILIGTDLPDIKPKHIEKAFKALKTKDAVFGPSEDGGYYLIGLSKMHQFIFDDKPWSQPSLLEETLKQLENKNISYKTLKTLNDIDTFEDLQASEFYKSNIELQEKIKQFQN